MAACSDANSRSAIAAWETAPNPCNNRCVTAYAQFWQYPACPSTAHQTRSDTLVKPAKKPAPQTHQQEIDARSLLLQPLLHGNGGFDRGNVLAWP